VHLLRGGDVELRQAFPEVTWVQLHLAAADHKRLAEALRLGNLGVSGIDHSRNTRGHREMAS